MIRQILVFTLASVLTDTAISSGGESNFNSLVLRSLIRVSLFSVGICLQTNFMMVKTLSMISLGQSVEERMSRNNFYYEYYNEICVKGYHAHSNSLNADTNRILAKHNIPLYLLYSLLHCQGTLRYRTKFTVFF